MLKIWKRRVVRIMNKYFLPVTALELFILRSFLTNMYFLTTHTILYLFSYRFVDLSEISAERPSLHASSKFGRRMSRSCFQTLCSFKSSQMQ